MAPSKKILILGCSGMLGYKFLQRLPGRLGGGYEVFGTLRLAREKYPKVLEFAGTNTRILDRIDLLAPGGVPQVLGKVNPDVILNCIGLTKRHIHGVDGERQAVRINTELPHELALEVRKTGARLIHFSTDCVFDGKRGDYTEASMPDAEDVYGRSKAKGELTEPDGRCLTLRSSFIGKELQHKTELLEWFLSQRGKTIRGFNRAIYSGLATWVLGDLVADLILKFPNLAGLYQVASEPVSKYELLCLMRDAFGIDVTILLDDEFVSRRNLDGSRFRQATGFVAPSWPEMMKGIANGC
jgi:dTDP-4-dehydrorhamnose reductase